MKPTIIRTHSFVEDAAELIIKLATNVIAAKGRFILGLCGGKTPEPVYAELARKGECLDWKKVIVTFGDERCVGPDHAESNYRMANQAFLGKIAIPPENVHRIQGEMPPEEAAKLYEKNLLQIEDGGAKLVQHDLLLLGIGDDGHTASLFPGTAALSEAVRLVIANYVPKFKSHRITFTYKLINASRHVCFLVNDHGKDSVVKDVLEGTSLYPAARVSATESLTWMIGVRPNTAIRADIDTQLSS